MAETHVDTPTTANQKRPLEDPSSPSGPNDQPDAKRPALDKILNGDVAATTEPVVAANGADGDVKAEGAEPVETKTEAPTDEVKVEDVTDKQGDTVVPDAPLNGSASGPAAPHGLPAHSPTATTGRPAGREGSQAPYPQQDETGWLHVRAIISSAEAATVIGKGGENVSQIRRMAGAKCTVSEYTRGAVERILTVSGLVDAVAKVQTFDEHGFLAVANNSVGVRSNYPHTQPRAA